MPASMTWGRALKYPLIGPDVGSYAKGEVSALRKPMLRARCSRCSCSGHSVEEQHSALMIRWRGALASWRCLYALSASRAH